MTTAVAAIYEQGVLRPLQPVELIEGTLVQVILLPRKVLSDSASPSQLLAEIAALPEEGLPDAFSGRDHDQVLYAERQSSIDGRTLLQLSTGHDL